MRKVLFVIILLMPLILITPRFGFCGGWKPHEPPSPEERIVGPAIDGILGVVSTNCQEKPYVSAAFIGYCKKRPVKIIIPCYASCSTPCDLSTVKERDLLYQRSPVPGPVCDYYKPGAEYIITKVKKFLNTGTQVIAEVTIRFVERK